MKWQVSLDVINSNVYHSACILISHLFFTPAQSLALQVVLGSTSMSSISGWPAGRTLYGLGSMSKSLPQVYLGYINRGLRGLTYNGKVHGKEKKWFVFLNFHCLTHSAVTQVGLGRVA